MSEDTATQNKPKNVPPPKKKVDVGGFGDAPLGGDLVEPVPFDKRERKASHHVLELLGLVLAPPQLALAITVLPLANAPKPALLAMIGGLVAAAILTVAVQVPLLRYGIPLGVLARAAFGWRGAKLFSTVRLLTLAAFYAGGVYLAMQTLWWCALCADPSLGALSQRITRVNDTSLAVVTATVVVTAALWFLRARFRGLLALPAVALVIALALLPDNAPFANALETIARAESGNLAGVFLLTMAWALAILLTPASDTRHQDAQIGQAVSVFAAVLPWLFGTLAFAMTGASDLVMHACQRLGAPWLVTVLGCAAVGYVWPLTIVTKSAMRTHVQEILGARATPLVSRSIEYTALVLGLGVAIAARLGNAHLFTLVMGAQLCVVAACLVLLAQYYLVDRRTLVLDELYTLRDLPSVLPAGWLSLIAGGAVFLVPQSTPVRIGLALIVVMLAHALFGNVQRLIRKR